MKDNLNFNLINKNYNFKNIYKNKFNFNKLCYNKI